MDYANYWASAVPTADLGDEISQSLRFPTNAGSERLEWATGPSTTTSWAVSFWMKLGQVGQATDGTIWQASGASSGPGLYINHNPAAGTDMGVLRDPNNGYSSGRSLRDPSAWYHIVHTFHASGGTNRVRIYINGETALDTTGVGATIDPGKFRIGGNAQWPQPQFQGYMAEWHFVSNNGNLTAADFGRTNEDGVWVPKNYTGTYGSNGFHLDFADSSDLGNDVSGNNNDFTASGFDTADIVNYRQDVFGDNSSTYNSSNTNKTFLGGTFGPDKMFNGVLTDDGCKSGTGSAQTWIYYRPSGGLSISSSLTVTCNNTGAIRVNGVDQGLSNTSPTSTLTISNPPSTLTELAVQGNTSSSATVMGITVDGTVRVENPDNDVDFLDTPTSNYPVWNPLYYTNSNGPQRYNEANLALDLSSASSLGYYRFFYATFALPKTGKWYFEHQRPVTRDSADNTGQFPFVGFSTLQGNYQDETASRFFNVISMCGGTGYGYRYGSSSSTTYGSIQGDGAWRAGAIIGCSYDADTRQVRFYKDGSDMGLFDTLPADTDFYIALAETYAHSVTKFNFGQMPFFYTPPTGFKPLHLNQLEEPTIKNGSDHFQAITDTGANILTAAQAAFSNGLWWIKDRANSNQHQLVDSVRGSNLAFTNPAKGPESTYAAPTGDCVAWCWGTDNTGTNADAGFQILTWDGTGSARTISHDLDQSRPLDMILVKMHSAAAGNTYVNNANIPFWCSGLADNGYGYFNLSNQFGTTTSFFNGNPNASLGNLTLGGDPDVNGNPVTYGATANYVGYVWQSVPGYSAFGSYTGNNSDDGPFIYTGMRSAFVMIKRTDANGNWYVWDSTRDINNPCYHHLIPDATNPENTNSGHGNQIDILSNGFKLRRNGGNTNAAGTYIYAAFAENPFGGENVPPATAR
jgi:hypothetical protein